MTRAVTNVTYSAPCLRPSFIPASRPRGAKALGLRYERAFAKAVPSATHGQWFQYTDDSGPGWCQPDFLLESRKRVVIIEVKLTDYLGALAQIENLYRPVLRAAYPEKKVLGLVVLRHLSATPKGVKVWSSLREALSASEDAPSGAAPLLHWLGTGVLV